MKTMSNTAERGSTEWRSSLPMIMFAIDISAAMGLKSSSAGTRAIHRLGMTHVRVGRRLLVTRGEFLAALKRAGRTA